jgi:hypothetical protein
VTGGTTAATDAAVDDENGAALPTADGLADAAAEEVEEGALRDGLVSMPLAPVLLLGFHRALIGVLLLLALALALVAEEAVEALAGPAGAAEDGVAAAAVAGFGAVVVAAAPPPPPNFAAAAAAPPATLCLDATVAVGAATGTPNLAATAATPPAAAGAAALSPGGTHFAGRDMIRCCFSACNRT